MMNKEKKRYLWVRPSGMSIIEEPEEIFHSPNFNIENDTLYEIGREVRMKVVIEPIDKVTYRGDNSYEPGTR